MNLYYGPLVCVGLGILHAYGSLAADHVPDTTLSELQEFLADSVHTPLCVLVRKADSKLEQKARKLWFDSLGTASKQFAAWRLGAVNITQVDRLPNYLMLNSQAPKRPLLRCFLGPTLPHDFVPPGGKGSKQLLQWLNQLVLQHKHLVNVSVDMIETSARQHHFTLLAFPTPHQHEQLEKAVYQVSGGLARMAQIQVIVIHPSSRNIREIVEKFRITQIPSVLVIQQDRSEGQKQTLYSIHDVTTNKMEADLRARLVPARHFTVSDFEAEVLTVKTSERYRPYLVAFYTHWEETTVFLSFLRAAVQEFSSLGASLRFAMVDAARNPLVVSQYMSPNCLQHLPFLALFQRVDGASSVNQTELLVTRPSAFTLYTALREAGFILTDRKHQPIQFQPYGFNTQVCQWREGPRGDVCAAGNSTWLFPADFLTSFLQHPDTEVSKQTDGMGPGLPVATAADWDTGLRHWQEDADLTVAIGVFIFITHPCRSCEQNLPTFQEIHQRLSGNDSFRVVLVNCTVTPRACTEHHVTGFPTVLAFRSHRSPPPCSPDCTDRGDCRRDVRRDYHGVITVPALMAWIREVSSSAVKVLSFDQPRWTQTQPEAVHLVATVVPKDSSFLPLPPKKNREYFYSEQCFRWVCERLFGLARCFTVNSPDLPPSHFHKDNTDFVITQVVFRRRDGAELTIMRLGQSLTALLDQEADHGVHLFHSHHSYELKQNQKCEEDHGRCSQFLEAFTRDHMRLPVTPLTSDVLHSHNDFLFGKNIPVLLALIEPDGSEEFMKMLETVSYTLYQQVLVASLDVTHFPAWAGNFVPRNYRSQQAERSDWGEVSEYPRLCLFHWHDHTRAAFFPPSVISDLSPASPTPSLLLSPDALIDFVQHSLQNPAASFVDTEQF